MSKPTSKAPRKRASGGSRRSKALAAARAAKRGPTFAAEALARYEERVGAPPLDDVHGLHEWHAKLLALEIDAIVRDPGIEPEVKRAQLAALSPQLSRALNPAELAADLRAFAAALGRDRRGTRATLETTAEAAPALPSPSTPERGA